MGSIWIGIGRLINPLVPGYLLMVGYILIGLFECWEPRSQQGEEEWRRPLTTPACPARLSPQRWIAEGHPATFIADCSAPIL